MNGYIQVALGGVKRGIKFGNRALLDVMAKHNNFAGGFVFSFDLLVDLVYFGMVNNCMVAKQNVDFDIDEVTQWVDDMDMDKLKEIFEVFKDSFTGPEPAGKIKKSVAAKKSE